MSVLEHENTRPVKHVYVIGNRSFLILVEAFAPVSGTDEFLVTVLRPLRTATVERDTINSIQSALACHKYRSVNSTHLTLVINTVQ
jgi:hypothetical protein